MKFAKVIACSLILSMSTIGSAFAAPQGAPAGKGAPHIKPQPTKVITQQHNNGFGQQTHNPQFNKNMKPGQPAAYNKHYNGNIKPGQPGYNQKYAHPGKVQPIYQKNVYNAGHAPAPYHHYAQPTYVIKEDSGSGAEKFIAGALIGAVVTTIVNNAANK